MMRFLLFLCLSISPLMSCCQVFMRPFDNAAAMSLGGATVAYPGLGAGLGNEALPAFGDKVGVNAGSALPFGISDWQVASLQGFVRMGANDGVGLDLVHSGIEAYNEQRVRLMYARRLGARFFLGGSAALMRVSAQEYGSANGLTFGLGILANVLPGFWLGARIHNPFQQKVGDYVAESSMRIGAAWHPSNLFLLSSEIEKSVDRDARIKAGIEYRPIEILLLRTGIRAGGGAASLGFGAGLLTQSGFAVDAGFEWHPSLGITPAILLAWRK